MGAKAKWLALQAWRNKFIAREGREPKIWFDKCCIDQTNIGADLRCLPIFLSGCQSMVVLCGPSYLSRLWCVVELFTFVHMRRGCGRLEFVPVLRDGHSQEDQDSIDSAFKRFDARECTCSVPSDKLRMLGIIRAAFGDLGNFNKAVRAIFASAGWLLTEDAQDV